MVYNVPPSFLPILNYMERNFHQVFTSLKAPLVFRSRKTSLEDDSKSSSTDTRKNFTSSGFWLAFLYRSPIFHSLSLMFAGRGLGKL
jgi:hypothetical protein